MSVPVGVCTVCTALLRLTERAVSGHCARRADVCMTPSLASAHLNTKRNLCDDSRSSDLFTRLSPKSLIYS